ncbi:MAG: hypothetical protein LBG62_06795 [Candidatus Methanoplasma sp.]|jgi:heme O synthase-like polyprenyltransferase|nr:hypothetical protein [Candidatus Methanoplasma sp.]
MERRILATVSIAVVSTLVLALAACIAFLRGDPDALTASCSFLASILSLFVLVAACLACSKSSSERYAERFGGGEGERR